MTLQATIISLIGAIISGALATIITLYVNHRSEIKRLKRELASDIYGYRFLINKGAQGAEKFYVSLNKVPIIFQDDQNVIQAYEALHNASQISDASIRSQKMNDCLVSFLKAICEATGIDCTNWNDSKVMSVFGG